MVFKHLKIDQQDTDPGGAQEIHIPKDETDPKLAAPDGLLQFRLEIT